MFSEGIAGQLRTSARQLRARLSARRAFANPEVPPLLVYQMGKVASSTVCASLQAAGLSSAVLQVHFLSDDLPEHIATHRKAGMELLPYHLLLGTALRKQLIAHPGRKCKVISLVRDPIAVVVSNIFQNPQFIAENIAHGNGEFSTANMHDWLLGKLADQETFAYQDSWFDKELKNVFGIDVFAQPFSIEKGYRTYTGDRCDALLIRVEDLSNAGPWALAEFLSMPQPLEFHRRNVRTSRPGGDAYSTLLANFVIDETLCREIYARRLVKHFYSDAMIESFIAKWTKQ